MNRVIGPAALALLLAAWPASAQSGWSEYRPSSTLFTVGYQMSQPVGSFNSYISSSSFRGFTFDWQSVLKKNLSAGLRFNWNRYDQTQSLATFTNPATNRTVTGPTYHYADQFAIQAIGHYYLDTGASAFTPYFGIGLGGVWSSSYQQTIDLGNAQNGFYFITTPELGLIINFAKGRTSAALNLSVLYNFTTAGFAGVSNASAITETIGVTLSY